MASVHYVDNTGRNNILKWSITKVSLMSSIACKQEPSSTIDFSPNSALNWIMRREVYICRTILEEMFIGYRFAI